MSSVVSPSNTLTKSKPLSVANDANVSLGANLPWQTSNQLQSRLLSYGPILSVSDALSESVEAHGSGGGDGADCPQVNRKENPPDATDTSVVHRTSMLRVLPLIGSGALEPEAWAELWAEL